MNKCKELMETVVGGIFFFVIFLLFGVICAVAVNCIHDIPRFVKIILIIIEVGNILLSIFCYGRSVLAASELGAKIDTYFFLKDMQDKKVNKELHHKTPIFTYRGKLNYLSELPVDAYLNDTYLIQNVHGKEVLYCWNGDEWYALKDIEHKTFREM